MQKKGASSSSCRKQDLRIVCKNFVCSRFFDLKVMIFFVTLNKLNILLEFYFDLHRALIYSILSWLFNTLGPDGSYMMHRSYGRNNRPRAKVLKLIYQKRHLDA